MTLRSRIETAVAIAAATLLAAVALAGNWEAIEHLPGQSPVTLRVNNNPRTYFRVTTGKPLAVPIQGPSRLRVVSRVVYPGPTGAIVTYRVRVTASGKELDHEDTETAPSLAVRGETAGHAIGKSRRLNVDIPKGTRQVSVWVDGPTALVRLLQSAPSIEEEPMVTLTPVDAPRSVSVTEGEKTIPYYSVMPGKPVKLRVVGPTTLDLLARLDFDATMRGTQAYRLAVTERGRMLRQVEFKTTKATTASYLDLKDCVPSKFDRLRIEVGEGMHEIEVVLLVPARGAAEIHARIPQPTVGSEE